MAEGSTGERAPSWDDFSTDQYPSIDVAFSFVIPRYQMSLTRFEAGQTRLLQIGTWIPTVFFAAVALVGGSAEAPHFGSAWFIAGAICAAVSAAIAWAARFFVSKLALPNLRVMYDEHLHLDPVRYKANWLFWASEAADLNQRSTERMYWFALAALLTFGVSIALLTAWATTQL